MKEIMLLSEFVNVRKLQINWSFESLKQILQTSFWQCFIYIFTFIIRMSNTISFIYNNIRVFVNLKLLIKFGFYFIKMN